MTHVALTEIDVEVPPDTLADCILHKTHHTMTSECWEAVLDEYFDIQRARRHARMVEDRNWYKWRYEQAVLADVVTSLYDEEEQ